MIFFITLLLHLTPLVFLTFETWSLKDKIRLMTLNNIRDRPAVSTVSLINSTIPTDIIEILLEPQILIPLIIGIMIILVLIVITFVLCTTERSNAITRIIYSIRGAPKQEDKDVTLNIQNNTSRPNSVAKQQNITQANKSVANQANAFRANNVATQANAFRANNVANQA